MAHANQSRDGDKIERLFGQSTRHGIAGLFRRWAWNGQVSHGADQREAEIRSAVMNRLPEGSPATYRALAQVVLKAWSEPTLRSALRENPNSTFAGHGVQIPAGTRIEIVSASEATLPTGSVVSIPLPAADEPAIAEAQARAALAGGEWEWLLGLPYGGLSFAGSAEQAEDSIEDALSSAQTMQTGQSAEQSWSESVRSIMQRRPVLTAFGAVAAAVGAVWIAIGADGSLESGSPISGTAEGAPGLALWIGLAAVIALVAYAAWMVSKR